MLGGADNPNGELLSYIIGADTEGVPASGNQNNRNDITEKCLTP